MKRLSSKELVILPFSWLLVKCCDGSQAFLALLWQILSRSSPYPHLKSAINFFSFSIWTLYIYIYISDLFIAITISAHGNRVDESTKHYEKWIHIFEGGKKSHYIFLQLRNYLKMNTFQFRCCHLLSKTCFAQNFLYTSGLQSKISCWDSTKLFQL